MRRRPRPGIPGWHQRPRRPARPGRHPHRRPRHHRPTSRRAWRPQSLPRWHRPGRRRDHLLQPGRHAAASLRRPRAAHRHHPQSTQPCRRDDRRRTGLHPPRRPRHTEPGRLMTGAPRPAHACGRYLIGGDLPVYRLGYGTMQLTGPGHWYHPADPDAAKRLLRRVVELGINHLDTADAYGPHTVEHLIRKALHPYPPGLVIAPKGGLTRPGPNRWEPVGRPAYLRQCIEMSLRRLAVDRIDLYYLHRIDPLTPLADQLGVLAEAQQAGKIRHIGLSKVSVAHIEEATCIAPVVAVQNRYNLTEGDDDVLAYCENHDIAFVPYKPLAAGALTQLVRAHDEAVTPAQAAIAYLLDKSPNMLPIPGTSDSAHLEENTNTTGRVRR